MHSLKAHLSAPSSVAFRPTLKRTSAVQPPKPRDSNPWVFLQVPAAFGKAHAGRYRQIQRQSDFDDGKSHPAPAPAGLRKTPARCRTPATAFALLSHAGSRDSCRLLSTTSRICKSEPVPSNYAESGRKRQNPPSATSLEPRAYSSPPR
jgi:hypothetical protein